MGIHERVQIVLSSSPSPPVGTYDLVTKESGVQIVTKGDSMQIVATPYTNPLSEFAMVTRESGIPIVTRETGVNILVI